MGYIATRPDKPMILLSLCDTLGPQQIQNFVTLHQTLFPQPYATGQRILDKIGDNHQVFAYTRGLIATTELCEAGKIIPAIDRQHALSAVPEAMRYVGAGHAKSKVVITLAG